ncbi:glutathione S-transferase family protein [Natronorubrum bangense]|uniref:Glutathione transferase n=2 Tax=Natronorubrum bangense TaxID=61858 RepID=L9W974_9EURY|nr:glutathione S-transferase family protein [Natronorubrum bangense]ELY44888.1 glutathione transferase [Natronorubrum bangense JCM 10635]QCC55022.1 glutathione S-transferase family protein [Natronorubrum bangense]
MNMLVDGEWRTDAYETAGDDGSFDRQEAPFRDQVRDDPDATYQPEAGRYHLYVSYACPWAHRTIIARALLGLEDAISVSVVDPYRGDDGWQFTPGKDGCTRDHVHDVDYLRELYVKADPNATCRVTVPVLWDTERETIVNNESKEIMRMFDTEFGDYATHDVDLYPEGYRDEIDRILDAIYEPINNGVYRAGFATEQAPYDAAIDDLFEALEHWDDVLAAQRYLAGDRPTEADIAMFTTLVRFDNVYHTHFMCNVQYIREYEHLWPYLRDLYQTGVADRTEHLGDSNVEERPASEATRETGIGETVHMDHIKEHYYTTHPEVTPHGIIARGPDLAFDAPHGRDELPGDPPSALVGASSDE